jgi:hypothetical protein
MGMAVKVYSRTRVTRLENAPVVRGQGARVGDGAVELAILVPAAIMTAMGLRGLAHQATIRAAPVIS